MEYRILGNTGLSVSVIALGCEGFVGKTEEQVHSEMEDRKSTRLNSSHSGQSRMPSSA